MEFISDIYDSSSLLVEHFNSNGKNYSDDYIKKYIDERLSTNGNKIPVDFQKGLDWINTSKSLSFSEELRGKTVILDFFTYCCINCMHILPQLKALEHQFKVEDGLVVVGVHSPKFANEHSTANVKAAVERYEITHPVVNDPEEHMWNRLGICCWPTLVVVGPGGELLLYLMGESHEELLNAFVKEALLLFKAKNLISHHTIPEIGVSNEYRNAEEGLHFPGKVCVAKYGCDQLVAVADTGHHRVLVLDSQGNVLHIIGCGTSGLRDGSFHEVQFHAPQGLVFTNIKTLFVADTENHALRKVDLEAGTVETVVGDGSQGEDRLGGAEGRSQRLSSPWDLALLSPSVLLIAMAGSHQLWAYYLQDTTWWKNEQRKAGLCETVVGSGKEENRNNAYPLSVGLAQPSGLTVASCRQSVYVADSESSTIRAVNINDGKVTNVVGGSADPQNLFAFGDKDGSGLEARLQHPLAVAWSEHKQLLYLADSYNHKVKSVDPATRLCTTLKGPHFTFNEPGGLCAIDNLLYVADTNNHSIKIINLDDNSIQNMVLKFKTSEHKEKKHLKPVDESHVNLASGGGDLELSVSVDVGAGIKPLSESPAQWTIALPDGWEGEMLNDTEKAGLKQKWIVSYPPTTPPASNQLTVQCKLFYCHRDTCAAKQLVFVVNVTTEEDNPLQKTHSVDYLFSL